MENSSLYRTTIWVSALVGAAIGLAGAWLAEPMLLFTPILPDSLLRAVPADASTGIQLLGIAGRVLLNLLHFVMWVGGSAAVAAIAVAYIGSLIRDPRA